MLICSYLGILSNASDSLLLWFGWHRIPNKRQDIEIMDSGIRITSLKTPIKKISFKRFKAAMFSLSCSSHTIQNASPLPLRTEGFSHYSPIFILQANQIFQLLLDVKVQIRARAVRQIAPSKFRVIKLQFKLLPKRA